MRQKEIWFEREGLNIYSLCYIPDGEGPFPTIIIGHGFGGSYEDNLNCAERYCDAGFAVCSFDFCGGTDHAKSDGKTTDTSVITEAKDMIAVFNGLMNQDFVDPNRIILWGESQGGFVAAMAASKLKEEVAALVLFYPAFSLQRMCWEECKDKDHIAPMERRGIMLGPVYATDIWDLDIYYEIAKYEGPVLILHGDSDDLVPIDVSKKALAVYKNATFKLIENAGHGFFNERGEYADALVVKFLNSLQ